MRSTICPEEKLLNLIKKNQTISADFVSTGSQNSYFKEKREAGKANSNFYIVLDFIRKYFGKLNFGVFYKKRLGIAIIFLAFSVVGLLIYLYVSNILVDNANNNVVDSDNSTETIHGQGAYTVKKIFEFQRSDENKTLGPSNPNPVLQKLISDYTFVGIILGDNPQVIVEDKNTGSNYYLSIGQNLGEFKIEKIEKGKVVVSYNDEKMDIGV